MMLIFRYKFSFEEKTTFHYFISFKILPCDQCIISIDRTSRYSLLYLQKILLQILTNLILIFVQNH